MFRCISIILHWQDITQKHHWNRQSMKFLLSRLIVSPPVLFSSSSGGFCGRCSFPSDSARLEKSPKKRIGRYVWKTVWVVSIFSDPWVSFLLYLKDFPKLCFTNTEKNPWKKSGSQSQWSRSDLPVLWITPWDPLPGSGWSWALATSGLAFVPGKVFLEKNGTSKNVFFPPPKSHKIILLS